MERTVPRERNKKRKSPKSGPLAPGHHILNAPTVERLLAAGADPNARDPNGDTAMDLASTAAAADALLKRGWKGADPARTAAVLSKRGTKAFDAIAARLRRMERRELAEGMSKPAAKAAARRI